MQVDGEDRQTRQMTLTVHGEFKDDVCCGECQVKNRNNQNFATRSDTRDLALEIRHSRFDPRDLMP